MRSPLVLLAVIAAGLLPHASAQQSYTFQTIDFPNIPAYTSIGGVDSAGDVVGYFGITSQSGRFILVGFARLANGRFVTLEDPNTQLNTQAFGISDSGVVVGNYSNNGANGFVYAKGGYQTFDFPGGQTELAGISTNNLIVGNHIVGPSLYGFQRTETGTIQALPNVNGLPVHATSINKNGVIVGLDETSLLSGVQADGFMLAPGGAYQLVNYPGATFTYLSGINDAGAVVGFQQITDSDQPASFIYSDGQFTDFAFPGGFTTQAFAINASGVIVGTYYGAGSDMHGFIATPVK